MDGNQQLYLQDQAGGGGQVFINQGEAAPQAGQVYVDENGAQVYYDPNQQEQQVEIPSIGQIVRSISQSDHRVDINQTNAFY